MELGQINQKVNFFAVFQKAFLVLLIFQLHQVPSQAEEGAHVDLTTSKLLESEVLMRMPLDYSRLSGMYQFEEEYRSGSGGDLFDQFIRFLFPISGREKRTMFMPLPYWGPKKPQYKKFDWKKLQTAHFEFYVYPEAMGTFEKVSRYLEEDYERNNRMFGVQNRFTKKIPVILYQTRGDFEQTFIVSGVVPEGLGGLTEIFSWKRATFPFEGDLSKLEHVVKHEGTHIYQIAKDARRLPLWFIEGNAEMNSIYWDADAEIVIRDSFFNGFFFRIQDLWQIQGTWLMYKQGNFINNLLWEEYGEEGFRKIYDRVKDRKFEDNLKDSLGLKVEDLDVKVQGALSKRYSQELGKKDLMDVGFKVEDGRILLHAKGPFYLSGGAHGPQAAIYLNHVSNFGKVTRKRIVEDREFQSESLSYFRKSAWMNDREIVYSIKRSSRDELRVLTYRFDEKKRKFELGKTTSYGWKNIDTIENPVILDGSRLAFVGYEKGFSNIYLYDLKSKKLEQLTNDGKSYSSLDYSSIRNQLVFSREEERAAHRIYYNRDLFLYDLATKATSHVTKTPEAREEQARFSPDGTYLLYVSSGQDRDLTYDLYVYNLNTRKVNRISKMKVGAKNPQWGEDFSIYFNGYRQMRPSVYQVAFPKASSMLALDAPFKRTEHFSVQNGKLLLNPASVKKSEPRPTQVETLDTKPEGIHIEDKGILLKEGEDIYSVRQAAFMGSQTIFRARRGRPNQKRIEEQLSNRYFVWDKDGLQSIDSTMVATNFISFDLRKKIEDELDGRPVIDAWRQGDHILLLVNNRLAKDNSKYEKDPDVVLIYYSLSTKSMVTLPEGEVDTVENLIQWVTFLKEGQIVLALSRSRKGPYLLVAFDPRSKKYKTVDKSADRFRVSKNHAYMVWFNEGEIYYSDQSLQPRRLQYEWKSSGTIQDFQIVGDDTLLIFTKNKKNWKVHEVELGSAAPKSRERTYDIASEEYGKILATAIDEQTGNIVIRTKHADRFNKPEQLLHWSRDSQEVYKLSDQGEGFQYSNIQFRQGYLFFSEYRKPFDVPKDWVWKDRQRDSLDSITEGTKISDQEWILRGTSKLLWIHPDGGVAKNTFVTKDNSGYSYSEDKKIYYSSPDQDQYQLYMFDTVSKSYVKPVACDAHCISPKASGGKLYWMSLKADQNEKQWVLDQAPLTDLKKRERIEVEGFDLSDPRIEKDSLTIGAEEKERPIYRGVYLPNTTGQETPHLVKKYTSNLKLQSLSAAAAYDGSNVRFFFSGFLDNILSDRGVFIDSVFLGDAKYASIGYADLRYGDAYTAFFNSRSGVKNYGAGYSKTFLLDRFREVNLYSEFEIQSYGLSNPNTANFVTAEIENKSFYLTKFGAVYGYDATSWDLHGPIQGGRFFFRTEAGYDTGNHELSNIDANIDVRLYHQLLPRFGFAHRLIAGTSQGNLPNVFLSGGNISFRGIGFDDLQGQNYWIFSEDLRIPVFDFVGAKFFDPVDQFLGAFTRFFDIRSGFYADVGESWFNDKPRDLLYSVGYFVNIPTLLGFNFRFNHGLIGEKKIGIWLGSNW